MANPLIEGVAAVFNGIAAELARINADFLRRLQGAPPPNSLPPPNGGSGSGGNSGSGSGGGGSQSAPGIPPPVVTVPTVDLFPATAQQPPNCPTLSASDYAVLLATERQAREQGVYVPPVANGTQTGSGEMSAFSVNAIPLEPNDFFRFRAYGSAGVITVSFFGRVATGPTAINPFNHPVKIANSTDVFQITPQAGPGWLLGAAASVPLNSITTGAVFAVGEIGRMQGSTFVPHTVLFSGQLSETQPLSSTLATPAQPVVQPTFRVYDAAASVTSPQTVTISPLTGQKFRLTRVQFLATCSSAVAARTPVVGIMVGGNTIWRGYTAGILTASQTGTLEANLSGQQNESIDSATANGPVMNAPLPADLYFYQSIDVQLMIQNNDSGDRISDIRIRWEDS